MKRLETDRLILDRWSKKDARELFAYASTPNVGPLAGWKPHESVKESKMRIKKLFIPNGTWKIMLKDGAKPDDPRLEPGVAIGSIGFEPDIRRPEINARELGYSLAEEYWGYGLMTEAGRAVIGYGFDDMDLDVISIETAPDKLRSQRVIEKLGFKYEGRLRDSYLTVDEEVRDTLVYSILKSEWIKLRTGGI
jgi:putative acetyltransferase